MCDTQATSVQVTDIQWQKVHRVEGDLMPSEGKLDGVTRPLRDSHLEKDGRKEGQTPKQGKGTVRTS